MAPVKSLEYFRVKPRWLFVKITDEQEAFGWGEATLEGHTRAVEGALDDLREWLVGEEARYDNHRNAKSSGREARCLLSLDTARSMWN